MEKFRAGYADRQILNDLSLTLPGQRVNVLVGPGGSGKTTFVKALLGSVPEIWCRAARIELPEGHHRVQWQTPATPSDRLGSLLVPQGTDFALRRRQALEIIARVWPNESNLSKWLEPRLQTKTGEIAPWYPRLAAFTAAVAAPASLYVFDEPDAELPSEAHAPLAERIRSLAPAATVLLVTHNLQLARQVGDYVVLMIDGEVIEVADRHSFFNQPTHARTRDFVRFGC